MSELVSIIIPTYNREKELKRALDSVLNQTYSNWEACVVDNNSSDETITLLNSYRDPRIKIFRIDNKGVIAASRNLGIFYSKGKYLAFLDSDDWWTRSKLEISIKKLEAKGVSVVYHDMYLARKDNQKFFLRKAKSRQLIQPFFNDLIINGNALSTSGVLLKKDDLIEISCFSEEPKLVAIEDFDAWLRLALLNKKFYKISKILGFYWLGGNNTSNEKRSIHNLLNLEVKFRDSIIELGLSEKLYWFNYSKGRANFKLKKMNQALIEFHSCLEKDPILSIKFKIFLMKIMISLKLFIHSKSSNKNAKEKNEN
jgi:glycosyltransferase involved in cell wall biosynthesis